MPNLSTWLIRALRALVTVGLLAFLLYLVDLRRMAATLASADPVLVLTALLVSVADRLLMVAKWYPLLRVQLTSTGLLAAGRAYLASGVAHYLLPASVGADVVRAVALGRGRRAVVEIGASIVAERVLGLVASAVMAVVAVWLASTHGIPLGVIAVWAGAAVGLGTIVFLLPLSAWGRRLAGRLAERRTGRLGTYLGRFGVAYTTYRRHPRLLALVGLLTVIEQLLPVITLWLVARGLGLAIGFGPMVVAVTLTLFAGRLPLSIGGLGVGEGALVYVLGLYGVPASSALALALLGRVLEILVNAGPAVFFWRDLVQVRRTAALETGGS